MTPSKPKPTSLATAQRASVNADGYRLPAEWEPHAATLLAWPINRADWPGKFQPIPWVFAEIIRALTPAEPVHLLIRAPAPARSMGGSPMRATPKSQIIDLLKRAHVDLARVEFLPLPLDRGWMRDCSPAFVINQRSGGAGILPADLPRKSSANLAAIHFAFNGWAKYPNHRKDAKVPAYLARRLDSPLVKATHDRRHVVLEGGGIDTNGAGTLVTTEECLLDPSVQVRNPGFTRADYEAVFAQFLGIRKVIWLGKGIAGDDTHGHVDDLCRFVSTNTVVLVQEASRRDANYRALAENRERLQRATDADGRRIDVVPLPMPAPLHFDGVRLPASYANFYIGNGRVLVPTFNDPNDRIALGILAELFPKHTVIGIHAVDLVWGLGTLHCLTHDLPATPNKTP